jgi:hypothetical protein
MVGLIHTCDIQRDQALGTNGRRKVATISTGNPCLFLPLGTATSIQLSFSLGRGYEVYFNDGMDVKIRDKLLFNGSSFVVRFVLPFIGMPFVSHMRVMAEQEVT